MTGFVAITGSRRPEDRGVLHSMLRTSAWAVLAAGLSFGTPALAQSANTPAQSDRATPAAGQGDETGVGEILVVGTRASLQSAIARKRKAETVVDSIVADDIASFPDKNVGDSLARITGVQLSRDFGEGVQVSIRGVEPDLNRVEINGISQVSASGTRAGDFRELATELVKSIDVFKGYSANLTEGGVGGTVSIQTRRPLELKKPLATLVLSEQHLDTTQDWRPRATLVAATPHFLVDGLGVMVNVTYDDKSTRQDYISNTNWSRLADFDRSDEKTVANPDYANFNTYASCANVGGTSTSNATARRLACETQFFDWAPTVPRYRSWVRRDRRISGDFQLQYEFARNFRAFAGAQINKRNQNLQDANYSLDMGRFERFNYDTALAAGLNGATSRPRIAAGTATVGPDHVVTSFRTADNAVTVGRTLTGATNILGVQRRNFSYDLNSKYYSTGFDWDLDRLNLKFLASRATAQGITETNLLAYQTSIAGVTVDRRNDLGVPVFVFPSTVNAADPGIYTDFTRRGANGQVLPNSGPIVQYRPGRDSNSENQLKLDADYETGLPFLKQIQYGGQLRWLEYLVYRAGGSRLLSPASGSTPAKYQSQANVSYTTNIVNNVTTRNDGTTYFLTPAEYVALVNGNSGVTGGAPLFTGLKGAPGNIPTRLAIPEFNSDALSQYYDLSGFDQDLVLFADGLPQIPSARIKESVAAGYLQFDMETRVLEMRASGNAGVRYIYTRDTGTGTNISRVTRTTATGGSETVVLAAQELSLSNDYVDILPTFNALLEITPDLVLRGNWAKNLARPRPTDLVPNINCLDDQTVTGTDDVCTAGNPDLKPYRATQWEANLAWYPNKDTMVSLGYYKKAIESFIVPNVTRTGVDLFRDGLTYTVRQPVNGEGALLDGIEGTAQTVFTFLPKPLNGFGISGNFTYARAIRSNLTNAATGAALHDYPGLSEWTWNASMFYDQGWLNARLSYNRRSDWLETVVNSQNGNNPIYRKGEGYLDAKVVFRFPKWHYQLFMEMQNIGKEYSETYINQSMPVDVYYPGQRFFAGIQFRL